MKRRYVEIQECAWKQDEDGIYHTDCGEAFYFDTGTAKENNAKYCHQCSRPIKEELCEENM